MAASNVVTCDCGAAVRLPADRANRQFRCPQCKSGIALTVDARVLESRRLRPGEAGATCPICQSSIAGDERFVVCPACEQVHHQECWSEIGGCGAYGCAQAPPVDKSENVQQTPLTAWGDTKRCPACGEEIKSIALRCRYCKTEFSSVDPMSLRDLRRQEVGKDESETLRKWSIGLFIASIPGCLAPLVAIVGAAILLPKRKLLHRAGPTYMIMGYASIGLSCLYTLLMLVFWMFGE